MGLPAEGISSDARLFIRRGEGMSAEMLRQHLQDSPPAVTDPILTLWKSPNHGGVSREVLVSAYDALGRLYDALDGRGSAEEQAAACIWPKFSG